jgi:excisionase family DNA binding protein
VPEVIDEPALSLTESLRQLVREEVERVLAERDAARSEHLHTTLEVAEMLGVVAQTVRRWVRTGALKAVYVGDSPRFRPADVDAFVGRGRATFANEPLPNPESEAARHLRERAQRRQEAGT